MKSNTVIIDGNKLAEVELFLSEWILHPCRLNTIITAINQE
jgi:hypothetical protein